MCKLGSRQCLGHTIGGPREAPRERHFAQSAEIDPKCPDDISPLHSCTPLYVQSAFVIGAIQKTIHKDAAAFC